MSIILSCTTTFERRKLLYYTFQSIRDQSLQPDIFLINISHEAYLSDSGFENVPDWIIDANDLNVKFNWVENTGPYRKLIPAINIAKDDDFIITADDDVLYHEDWLKNLIEHAKVNPDSIIAGEARHIAKNIFGNWKNYKYWNRISENKTGLSLLPIGADGVLYRKPFFDLEFLLDDSYLDICPTTDDLWFRAATLINNITVCVIPQIAQNNIHLSHNYGLQNHNLNGEYLQNDHIRSIFSKPILRSFYDKFKKTMDYLGVNRTKNDRNWDKIQEFLKR